MFYSKNSPNSNEVNWVPLSETICSGIPCVENNFRSSVIVFSEVMVAVGITSGHFVHASTTIKKYLPSA